MLICLNSRFHTGTARVSVAYPVTVPAVTLLTYDAICFCVEYSCKHRISEYARPFLATFIGQGSRCLVTEMNEPALYTCDLSFRKSTTGTPLLSETNIRNPNRHLCPEHNYKRQSLCLLHQKSIKSLSNPTLSNLWHIPIRRHTPLLGTWNTYIILSRSCSRP